MSTTGLGFLGTTIKGPSMGQNRGGSGAGSGSGNRNSKYMKISEIGKHRIRLVSGFFPYYAHYIPGQGYKISPRTLLLDMVKECQDENGQVKEISERVYLKADSSPYSEAEAVCPIFEKTEKKPQLKYAINVIDRDEQAENPDGPVPIKILTGPYNGLFENFFTFEGEINPFPPFDLVQGPDFIITTQQAPVGEAVNYSVDYFKQASPLNEKEMASACKFKYQDPNDKFNGLWELAVEYHPFKCPLSMRVDGIQYDESPDYRRAGAGQPASATVSSPPPVPVTAQPAQPVAAAPVAVPVAATVPLAVPTAQNTPVAPPQAVESFGQPPVPQAQPVAAPVAGTAPVGQVSQQIQPVTSPPASEGTTIEDIMNELNPVPVG